MRTRLKVNIDVLCKTGHSFVISKFSRFPKGVPWVRYHGIYKDLQINIIWPGKDPYLGEWYSQVIQIDMHLTHTHMPMDSFNYVVEGMLLLCS